MTQPYRRPTPEPRLPPIQRILVASNFDDASEQAIDVAASLARSSGTPMSIHILCVLEALMYTPPQMAALSGRDPDLHPEASRRMAHAVRRLHELGIERVEHTFEFGIPADVIVRFATSGRFDMLVLGRHDRGSTSAKVFARSTIPVLVVPPGP